MSRLETMDGNQAAAYASYAFTEVAAIFRSPLHPQWPKQLMNGRPMGRRTCSGDRSRWWKCSPKPVLPVPCTDHWPQVP